MRRHWAAAALLAFVGPLLLAFGWQEGLASLGDDSASYLAQAQALVRFAAVAADGTLGGKRGVSSSARTAAGTYTVVFDNDVSGCALSATQTQFENAGAVGVQVGDDKKTVTVRTRAGGGADGLGATDPADRPFHLTANC